MCHFPKKGAPLFAAAKRGKINQVYKYYIIGRLRPAHKKGRPFRALSRVSLPSRGRDTRAGRQRPGKRWGAMEGDTPSGAQTSERSSKKRCLSALGSVTGSGKRACRENMENVLTTFYGTVFEAYDPDNRPRHLRRAYAISQRLYVGKDSNDETLFRIIFDACGNKRNLVGACSRKKGTGEEAQRYMENFSPQKLASALCRTFPHVSRLRRRFFSGREDNSVGNVVLRGIPRDPRTYGIEWFSHKEKSKLRDFANTFGVFDLNKMLEDLCVLADKHRRHLLGQQYNLLSKRKRMCLSPPQELSAASSERNDEEPSEGGSGSLLEVPLSENHEVYSAFITREQLTRACAVLQDAYEREISRKADADDDFLSTLALLREKSMRMLPAHQQLPISESLHQLLSIIADPRKSKEYRETAQFLTKKKERVEEMVRQSMQPDPVIASLSEETRSPGGSSSPPTQPREANTSSIPPLVDSPTMLRVINSGIQKCASAASMPRKVRLMRARDHFGGTALTETSDWMKETARELVTILVQRGATSPLQEKCIEQVFESQ